MTDQSPEPTYKPGDVANGHMLGADGVWRALGQPPAWQPTLRPAEPKPWHKNVGLRITAGVVGVLLLVGSVSAANGTDSSTSNAHSASLGDGADPDAKWGVAFTAAGGVDMIQEVADHSGKAGDAATGYDLETAADESYAAQSASDDVLDLIDSLDESEDSPLAQDARDVWQQCSDAYGFSGDVLSSYNLGSLDQASAGLSTCSEGMQGLTARVNGLTE